MKLQLNQALPPARESRGIFIRAIISVAGGQRAAPAEWCLLSQMMLPAVMMPLR